MTDESDNMLGGDQTTISSGGGDVAGGDIDKRRGETFVEGSTVIGDIIGKQIVQLPPHLSLPTFILMCILIVIIVFFAFSAYSASVRNAANIALLEQALKNQPGNHSLPDKNITGPGVNPNDIGFTVPTSRSQTLAIVYYPTIYDLSLKLGQSWDNSGVSIGLKGVRYARFPILLWHIQNYTDQLLSIPPYFIETVDIFDERGNTYPSSSSSCDTTQSCAKIGFNLLPQDSVEFTNTIDIDQSGALCQTFFIKKPSVKSNLTRLWLIQLNC